MRPRVCKRYSFNGLAGCVEQRKRRTGFVVGLYHAEQAGMESDPATPWATVCEEHNTICVHTSLFLARDHAVDPEGWCEDCRKGYLRNYVVSQYVVIHTDGTLSLTDKKADATLLETDHDLARILMGTKPMTVRETIAGYPMKQFEFVRLTGAEVEARI